MPRPPKRTPPTKPKYQQTNQDLSKRGWSRVWTVIVGIGVVAGLAASLVTFLPRITVEAGAQLDPLRPYPIPFTITNTGVIPLNNVQPAIGVCYLSFGEPRNVANDCHGSLPSRIVFTPWFVAHLAPGEKHVIKLDNIFPIEPPGKLGSANISIVVEYQPWFLPISRETEYRFITRLEKDGKVYWIPTPVDK